jgi:hypothetical protein
VLDWRDAVFARWARRRQGFSRVVLKEIDLMRSIAGERDPCRSAPRKSVDQGELAGHRSRTMCDMAERVAAVIRIDEI